jgi:hypothetical protein
VRPGSTFPTDHSGFSDVAGSEDCSTCHAWPGTGTVSASWLGASGGAPAVINTGGFTVPQPPAPAPATTPQPIANLPHPTVAAGTTCTSCHASGGGGKLASGYDHASALINGNCNACHEAGSNLVGTPWSGATAQASGAGDTRPFTLASVVASYNGGSKTVTYANHFYPVDCTQCHTAPSGVSSVTTGATYTKAWTFPHKQSLMTNPSTCSMCHGNNIPN